MDKKERISRTINRVKERLNESLDKAISKHPDFVDRLCEAKMTAEQEANYFETMASSFKHRNPDSSEGIIIEELYEFLAELSSGNRTMAFEELMDLIAVAIRTYCEHPRHTCR